MKIITWNVNSVGSRIVRLQKLLERHAPDILCLQELKCLDEKFPMDVIRSLGYEAAIYGQKTYNGVAILSKKPIKNVLKGFGFKNKEEDPAARLIAATVEDVRVVCAYCPNGQSVGSDKYSYKLDWFSKLRDYLDQNHTPSEKLVLLGDFNVAPEPRDVHDPSAWEGKILFSDLERRAFGKLCLFGLTDTFRLKHTEPGFYSWWDYRQLAFPFNKGLRIDFILATNPMATRCIDTLIDRDERKGEKPSDHAPVVAVFE